MSVVSDFIVYIWLLPVAAQILLPLTMLVVHLVSKGTSKLMNKEEAEVESVAGLAASAKTSV